MIKKRLLGLLMRSCLVMLFLPFSNFKKLPFLDSVKGFLKRAFCKNVSESFCSIYIGAT